jgi:uncharacterized protein
MGLAQGQSPWLSRRRPVSDSRSKPRVSLVAAEEELVGMRVGMVAKDAYESLIRRTYEDFETGDLDLLRVVMANDVVWHEPGRSKLAGTYRGPEAVLGFLATLKSESGGTFKIEVLDVLSKPERVVVLQRDTATKAGKDLNVIVAVEFEIHHEKITEVTVYQADSYLFDEFWADDSGQEDNMDDIQSELEGSTREAGVGSSS